MGNERLDGKPRRKGGVWFLGVASVCDGGGEGGEGRRGKARAERQRLTVVCRRESHFQGSGVLILQCSGSMCNFQHVAFF